MDPLTHPYGEVLGTPSVREEDGPTAENSDHGVGEGTLGTSAVAGGAPAFDLDHPVAVIVPADEPVYLRLLRDAVHQRPEPPSHAGSHLCEEVVAHGTTQPGRADRSDAFLEHRSRISERTRLVCRLRWHLHELDPAWEPKARSLDAQRTLDEVRGRLHDRAGVVARLAVELTERCAELTSTIKALEKEITELTTQLAPALLALPGCGALTAAKIIGETAGVDRFKSRDAYARFNGTAPLPVWSSNKARHRLSRTGNRQLNAALHRIALTQARWHPPAKEMIERRKSGGNSGREALRVLKRRLSDAVFQALLHDQTAGLTLAA